MMSKGAWAAWVVKNSVVMVCFTALALYFGHWWIALFACLCMSSFERKVAAGRTCDGCGKAIHAADWNDLDAETKKAGWIRKKNYWGKWEDYCPECQAKGRDCHDD